MTEPSPLSDVYAMRVNDDRMAGHGILWGDLVFYLPTKRRSADYDLYVVQRYGQTLVTDRTPVGRIIGSVIGTYRHEARN